MEERCRAPQTGWLSMLVEEVRTIQTIAQRRWIDRGASSATGGVVQQCVSAVACEPVDPETDRRSRHANSGRDLGRREAVQRMQHDARASGDALRRSGTAHPSFETRPYACVSTHGDIRVEKKVNCATQVGDRFLQSRGMTAPSETFVTRFRNSLPLRFSDLIRDARSDQRLAAADDDVVL